VFVLPFHTALQISDAGLEHLRELPNLKPVNLNGRKPLERTIPGDGANMTIDVKNRLKQALPNCRFHYSRLITTRQPKSLIQAVTPSPLQAG
jgi:hypothetical protein